LQKRLIIFSGKCVDTEHCDQSENENNTFVNVAFKLVIEHRHTKVETPIVWLANRAYRKWCAPVQLISDAGGVA